MDIMMSNRFTPAMKRIYNTKKKKKKKKKEEEEEEKKTKENHNSVNGRR